MTTTDPKPELLKPGGYSLRFFPHQPDSSVLFYEGTLRVMRLGNALRAAGDLYCRLLRPPPGRPSPPKAPPKIGLEDLGRYYPQGAGGMPVFAREDYRFYLQLDSIPDETNLRPTADTRMDIHEFDSAEKQWRPLDGCRLRLESSQERVHRNGAWTDEPIVVGTVVSETTGEEVGLLHLIWLSGHCREATVQIHANEGIPIDGLREIVELAFGEGGAGWNLNVKTQTDLSAKPPPGVWTPTELHEEMLRLKSAKERDAVLDQAWEYQLLVIGGTIEGYPRGVMFDSGGVDSNHLAREGAAVAGGWKFEGEAAWGGLAGQHLCDGLMLGRVAVHELGHAMGLQHNELDCGFMNTTDEIARRLLEEPPTEEEARMRAAATYKNLSTEAKDGTGDIGRSFKAIRSEPRPEPKPEKTGDSAAKFPNEVSFVFHPDDRKRLRLAPDLVVRPGTAWVGEAPMCGDTLAAPAEGLEFEVFPTLDSVPFGAPVRLDYRLRNVSSGEQAVPAELGLTSGRVNGEVIDSDGKSRSFWPVKVELDAGAVVPLEPGKSRWGSMSLVRGVEGGLFPRPGGYRIRLRLAWEAKGRSWRMQGEGRVEVEPRETLAQASLACRILDLPEAFLGLVIGGRKFAHVHRLLDEAGADSVLGPHYQVFSAKRHAAAGTRVVAAKEITAAAVLSLGEIERLAEHLPGKEAGEVRSLLRAKLNAFVQRVGAGLDAQVVELDRVLARPAADATSAGGTSRASKRARTAGGPAAGRARRRARAASAAASPRRVRRRGRR